MRSGRDVKRYMRQFSTEQLTAFRFDGRDWGLTPRTAFYDWLYLRALRALADRDRTIDATLGEFEAFTDIEFNPDKSLNCQARSCACTLRCSRTVGFARRSPTPPNLSRRSSGPAMASNRAQVRVLDGKVVQKEPSLARGGHASTSEGWRP